MRKHTTTTIVLFFLITFVSAQKVEVIRSPRYIKTIEQNHTVEGKYNFDTKNDDDRLLFGDFNAPTEFLFAPSFDGISGLRVYGDSLGRGYLLEVKRVTNWKEVNDWINAEFAPRNEVRTLTLAQWEEQKKQMQASEQRKREEWLRRQTVRSQMLPISDTLAGRIKTAITSAIGRVKKGENENPKPEHTVEVLEVIKDGDSAIFRCVVGDHLWTLRYHVPSGEFKTLSDLFRAMIADVEAGTFDEAKYIEALN